MSKSPLLSKLRFLRPTGRRHGCTEEKSPDQWTELRCGQREWEDLYRRRWQYDKKVRSTHGVTLYSFVMVVAGSILMVLATRSIGLALVGEMALALGMGFANAAVFKLVPKYSPAAVGGAAGIVGGLGAFGGFVVPPLMGLFVKFSGQVGYAQGFNVFLALAVVALALFVILNRYALSEAGSAAVQT
jgi:nitrate/nitrite transporter NarK